MMLKIRRISQLEKQLKTWQQQYQVDVVNLSMQPEQRYFNVRLQGEMEYVDVRVNAEDWCRHRWPDLSHYAWSSLSMDTLCDIFVYETQDKQFFDNQFVYHSIDIIERDDIQSYCLSVKENTLGNVLFSAPFEGLAVREKNNYALRNIVLTADWVLGYSYISLSLLRSLALGDALYIQQLQLKMAIAGREFAQFQKQEEGLFMIEEILSPEEGIEHSSDENYQTETENSFNLADMSIKLTFVLGHSEIPLTELNDIQLGSIFSIGKNKEREVKVYANKQLVAEGELIYLGDENELGLEITRIISLGDKRV
ncbi:FliM/FliN family flagellar motor switch protein [Providencia sp. PROV129]|uniref:FliM/FliN family flagellar motor switch protein n=1 Tax=Providencia sp. PROV129 TaxID=2949839 RepID=UPI0023491C98|nr:FliM/FliN family flagellar motor switch protein [Providencia sp. PROV129]